MSDAAFVDLNKMFGMRTPLFPSRIVFLRIWGRRFTDFELTVVEEQAIDRVHRLNQTLDVTVYKLTIANTVEARILDLQEKKRALANAAIGGDGKAAGKLSMRDILNLFRRDAEHDGRHEVDASLGGKTKILAAVARSGSGAGNERREQSMRVTPPAMEHRQNIRTEDPVYGRKW